MKNRGILIITILFRAFTSPAQALFEVEHYNISLDISNISSKSIQGGCTISLTSKSNSLQQVDLSLLQLNIDSVISEGIALNYTYDDTTLNISLSQPLNNHQTKDIKICYHGQPVEDATWGGFYFSGGYAFNIGVAFTSEPHTFGRVWFPCVDNFTDRATFEMHITTAANDKAFCSGLLQNTTSNSNGTINWHWQLDQEIPTYLASVAVAGYTALEGKFPSIAGDSVPYSLAALPADTAKLRSSFVHLKDAFNGFEERFGPYRFDRVGFAIVPFSGGAMEHATNIAYPRFAVTGSLQYETLMAHEFSHHWFGDLVTCKTPEDMWLNEGWASYCESIFMETVYGKEAYKEEVRKNHKNVLQNTHIRDDGYRAVSGVPHDHTYGSTVYDKGADIAHTLRGYMGDSLFFSCLKSYMEAFKFDNASSYDFRDFLTQCSGIDLTSFFDNWVFNPGFPHFSIDSFFTVQNGSTYDVTVFIHQRIKEAPAFYSNVPLELTFMSNNFDSVTTTAMFSGGCGIFYTTLNFKPDFIAVDMDEKISDAITDNYDIISATGTYTFDEAMMTLNVTQVSSNVLVRVEHNWVAPDPMETIISGLHISNERFWRVDGIIPNNFVASAQISYDGTAASGYLDQQLITNSEDSLVILFRPDLRSEWSLYSDFTINTQGNASNKRGQMTINNILKGEYALGIWDHNRAVSDTQVVNSPCIALSSESLRGDYPELNFNIYPNPANDSFFIKFDNALNQEVSIRIYDLSGKIAKEFVMKQNETIKNISINERSKSAYLVTVSNDSGAMIKKVFVLN